MCFPILIWIRFADPNWTPEYSISRLVIALPDGKNPCTTRNYYFRRPCARAPENFSISANTLPIAVKEKVLNNWCFHCDLTLPPSRTEATLLPYGKHSAHSNCFGCRVPPVRQALATTSATPDGKDSRTPRRSQPPSCRQHICGNRKVFWRPS